VNGKLVASSGIVSMIYRNSDTLPLDKNDETPVHCCYQSSLKQTKLTDYYCWQNSVIDTFFGKKYVRKPKKDKAVSIAGQE
jgi:hypothetical protein